MLLLSFDFMGVYDYESPYLGHSYLHILLPPPLPVPSSAEGRSSGQAGRVKFLVINLCNTRT
jgi:hypothetical protein